MLQLLGLVGFAFVSAGTPGPNNVLLWASGTAFGFRRTVPHIIGTAAGIAGMALAAGAGLAALVAAVPVLGLLMRLVGSTYLVFLAWQIAHAGALTAGDSARPMTLVEGAAFQLVNPKAWIFALGAVSTFRSPDLPPALGTVVVALVMVAVILPAAGSWAAFGSILARFLERERTRRIVNLALAGLVLATVALVWI
ncbi:MAG TPA: LysE family transporter [Candidatus Dormibacteraeota bacterium]|nr:LysE family transporter [Candidatus Dormibacteraeota bacterium]